MKNNMPEEKLMCPYFGPTPIKRNRKRLLVSHLVKRREVS